MDTEKFDSVCISFLCCTSAHMVLPAFQCFQLTALSHWHVACIALITLLQATSEKNQGNVNVLVMKMPSLFKRASMTFNTPDLSAGELRQECDRAAAVCQKEQAKPSYLEQTARRNEETSHAEGENYNLQKKMF